MKHIYSTSVAAAIALSALWALSANAQTATPGATATDIPPTSAAPDNSTLPAPAATPAVDDAKLEKFADAYVKIQAIQKEAFEKQKSNSDPAAAQQQQTELQGKMMEAVQTSGLDVNEFNQIAQAMTTDSSLRAKVIAKVQQRNQNQGG